MLITVLAAKVLLNVAVPEPFNTIVWLLPPLRLYVTVAFGVPVKVIVALSFEHIVVGKTLTLAVGNGNTVKVTLLGVLLVQLGVPELVTLTMLITVLAAKVLLNVAVPEPFNTIVWLLPPLRLYVTVAFGVPVKVIVALSFEHIVVGKTLTLAVGNGNIFTVTVEVASGHGGELTVYVKT